MTKGVQLHGETSAERSAPHLRVSYLNFLGAREFLSDETGRPLDLADELPDPRHERDWSDRAHRLGQAVGLALQREWQL